MLINVNNSFSIFCENDVCIWMDPWVGTANYGSWAALYEASEFEKFIASNPYPLPDLVYISHLHTDHYDVDFLNFLKEHTDLVVMIKDFNDGRLRKRILEEVNPSEVISLRAYENYEFKGVKLMIIPQVSASSADTVNQLEYDLDTSLIIETEDTILFNEVDNPLHVDDYRNEVLPLSKWSRDSCKTKIGLIGYSGASDYPQSYLEINRHEERRKVIDKTIDRFWDVSRLLKLDYVIPAGGTFMLDGVLSSLNEFTPVPTFQEVNQKHGGDCQLINPLECILHHFNGEWHVNAREDDLRRIPEINNASPFFRTREYASASRDELHALKSEIEIMMPEKLKSLFKGLNTQIQFMLYEEDPVFDRIASEAQSTCDELLVFEDFTQEKKVLLEIHLHWEMLMKMLRSDLIWNELTFHCVYRRDPNIYEPDAVFALNLYKKLQR